MSDRIRRLFDQYLSGALTREEWKEMLEYFQQHGVPEELDASILNELMKRLDPSNETDLSERSNSEMDAIAARVEQNLRTALAGSQMSMEHKQHSVLDQKQRTPIKRLRKRVAISAASVAAALLLWAGWYAISSRDQGGADVREDQKWALNQPEILPAGNRASLKLSDGRIIDLDESHQGIVVDGQEVRYRDGSTTLVALEQDAPVETITLSTPRGGTYSIRLPDGTQVWLNAASTLTYPSRFTIHERVVQLEGEAYFDVQALADQQGVARPFQVESATQRIEVLGTEFNVSAYADESVARTTLVEGSVRVYPKENAGLNGESALGRSESLPSSRQILQTGLLLKPGEQSRTDGQNFSKVSVNVRDYTDWKHGEFVFRNETTREVLLRLGRWYDVELGELSPRSLEERFSGTISRYGDFPTVLDIMSEAAGLRFQVEDRTVHVR